MPIVDGQPVDAANSNPAWLDAQTDDAAAGKINFENTDPVSGSFITNIQKNVNSIGSFLGWAINSLKDVLPTWLTNYRGISTDDIKTRVDGIDAAFGPIGGAGLGHTHDGTSGNGPLVDAATLGGLNYFASDYQTVVALGITGGSTDVSTQFSGLTPGGNPAQAGVLTTPPENIIYIFDANTLNPFEDPSGNEVYGRLTESVGVWTLTYYVLIAGVETAYSFPGTEDILIYYQEVFTLATVPTIKTYPKAGGTLNVIADIPDATPTVRGAVNIGAQTFGGAKAFQNSVELQAQLYGFITTDAVTTGSNQTLATPTTTILRLTNAGLVSIDGLTAPTKPQMVILANVTTVDIYLNNELGTAANRILTGTNADLKVKKDATVWLWYDFTSSRWRLAGGSGGGGGNFVSANFTTTTIVSTDGGFQKWRYTGGSAQTLTAITTTLAIDAAIITIMGTSDTNTITLSDNDVSSGWILNGDWVGYTGSTLTLQWDATLDRFYEVSRSA